ncbi:serine/threonine-protein kinase [Thiococcus pfennigii]|uniref:serine/threonine-protein kinase n=1 Tax=Thiococcus pfennigii TaxID=1057 RepID=UPI0019065E62|nr:serine/threonine-protein kinase [Thiococcus pfennigii]MBK1730408.1 serine/threonine protein kinase [Thiococcus pfennigii]
MATAREDLAPGTLLAGYRIVKRIGTGGFSLIYLGTDEENGDEVVLKEYMPKRVAVRDARGRIAPVRPEAAEALWRGRRLFFQEVKAMASLHHPNILAVRDFFLANDTGYLVTRYQRGRNLWAYVRERHGGLSPTFLLEVFLPILDALALIHAHGLLHLDVKPSNIHLRHGHEPLLLDLGAVHHFDRGTNPGGQIVSAGFSPTEQYYRGGHLGPWSDVYAVGASLRACIEGRPPPAAVERQPQDRLKPIKRLYRDRYPLFLLEAIDWSMTMDPAERPQDAAQLLAALRRFVDLPAAADAARRDPTAGGRIDAAST